MKKILFVIILVIIFIGVFSYKKYNSDINKINQPKVSLEEILEYGKKLEETDMPANTIVAKLNNEPILYREIGTKKIQLNYSKNNSNQENIEEKNAFYEVLVEKLYIEYAKKYPKEVEYNLHIDQTLEKTEKELTEGYDGKTAEECKKEMLDLMCIKEEEVWFDDEDFIPYVQSMQVDNMLTAKGISIISKFMIEKPELANDKELENKVKEYSKSKEKQLELLKGNTTEEIRSSINNSSSLLDEIRELYIKDLLLNSKIELCVEKNEFFEGVPEIYKNNKVSDTEDNTNNAIDETTNNYTQNIEENVKTGSNNAANTPSNSDFNKIYSDSIENLEIDYFLRDFKNYAPESDEIKISETRAREIAEIGFQESANRIAGEGVENKDSEKVKLENISANNYFTRQYSEGDKTYKEISRKCYIITRENDMGCGVSIYVDATTGLIIGGRAFGD